MKSIYTYADYKTFVRDWISAQANGGRGLYQQIGQRLKVHRATISQIFAGEKNLSLEQAAELVDYLGLNVDQGLFFLDLVSLERSGSEKLRTRLNERISLSRQRSLNSPHASSAQELNQANQTRFYEDWKYSAVSVLQNIPHYKSPQRIASKLHIPLSDVVEITEFLEELQVTKKKVTYLSPSSPLINLHRTQWRIQGIQRLSSLKSDEIAFSAPLSLSNKDYEILRAELRSWIDKVYRVVKNTEPEVAVLFNLDWMKL